MKREHIILGVVVVIIGILLIAANIPAVPFVDDYGTDYGAVGVWNFEEGTGTTTYDQSPYGNDGSGYESSAWVGGGLADWDKRVKITINSTDVDEALTNFPVMIFLSNSTAGENDEDVSFIFDEIGANYLKIAITSSDKVTQLYVEVDKWDSTNEQAWLHTKVPVVSNTSDTDIYLYYDNDRADNTDYVGVSSDAVVHNVWDANFILVSHMRDDPDNTAVRDSTVNANDGAKKDANEPIETASGGIDSAQDFDGSNDYVNYGHDTTLNVIDAFTLEFFLSYQGGQSFPYVFSKSTDGALVFNFRGSADPEEYGLYINFDGAAAADFISAGTVAKNVDTYLVGTYNRVNIYLYKNGVVDANSWARNLPLISDPNGDLYIGNGFRGGAYGRAFDGIIDEVRISNIARTAIWIKASYESIRDHLNDFGSEELKTIIPNIFWTTGKYGQAINFTSSYVSVGNVSLSVKTVEFWAYLDTTTEPILELSIGVDISASAGTITATGFAGTTTIYVDGVESSTVKAETWHYVGVTSDTAEDCSALYFGKVDVLHLDGKLDQVRAYTETKTLGEIKNHYLNSGHMYSGSVIVSDDFRILNTTFGERIGLDDSGLDMNDYYILNMPFESWIHVDLAAGVTDIEISSIPSGVHTQDRRYALLHISVETAPGGGKWVNVTLSDGTNSLTCSITGAEKTEATTTGAFDLDVSAETLTLKYSQTAGGASTGMCVMSHWWYIETP